MIEFSHVGFERTNQSQALPILTDVSLSVGLGEMVTFFGPNGCGKSTLLNLAAGLEYPTVGTIRVDGAATTADGGKVGFVFQNYQESLFPWLTVRDNVAFPLEIEGESKESARKHADEILALVRLEASVDRYPYELSGGMRQLVAICRAMVVKPDVLLLDEPCSALDYATTKRVELDMLKLWEQWPCAAICVSHDVDEAVLLADRVVVLSPKPGAIKEIIPVNLPRPRTLDMLTSPEFIACRARVLEAFAYER